LHTELFLVTLAFNIIKMEVLLVKPENNEQMKAVKAVLKALNIDLISKKEKEYKPEFVKKIQESRKQAKEGKVTSIDPKNLWK
jgi:hypothetical protein